MDHQPQRYADFVDHLATLCGVDMGIVHRHSGIIVTTSSLSWPWVRDFIPGVSQVSLQRLGTFGLSLAHLSLWAKIHNSDMCKGSDVAKEYVLIFEDDERPKPGFTEAIVKLRHALDALPLEERPDFINLNVKRPKGDVVTTFELPFAVSVLRVAKTKSKLKTGPLDALGNQYNVWMSAYMVRCGGIGALVYHGGRYPGGKNSYNGISPIFDKQMSDMLANSRIHLKYFVLSPKNAISQHVEGVDSRKALDARRGEDDLPGQKRALKSMMAIAMPSWEAARSINPRAKTPGYYSRFQAFSRRRASGSEPRYCDLDP
eukprot:CAMPEP_0204177038 /NCGR_PEP_ID=MMETSP0361-20130328/48117_1 /ASSEMBLY_ACC=CAM_ASM_000343 /TAXON_ID=268821 /ORGANISM="Scrippsiella Hangoei, Strain SHTV-5" /LENGTH=315 /DNA_ID=CAMNT_0051135943 /DNA_START=414 /DNA_END=1360 /DNA_ORIENTATION=-